MKNIFLYSYDVKDVYYSIDNDSYEYLTDAIKKLSFAKTTNKKYQFMTSNKVILNDIETIQYILDKHTKKFYFYNKSENKGYQITLVPYIYDTNDFKPNKYYLIVNNKLFSKVVKNYNSIKLMDIARNFEINNPNVSQFIELTQDNFNILY